MWPIFVNDLASRLDTNVNELYGSGTFVINNTSSDALDDQNFNAIRDALVEYLEDFEDVDPSEIPGYLPNERDRAQRSLYIKNEGWVQPRILLDWLKAAALLNRVKFVTEDISSLEKNGSSGWIVNTERVGNFNCDIVILAAGASSTDILKRSNLDFGIQRVFYGVGVSIELVPRYEPTKCIRTPNRGLACGVYTAPYFDQSTQKTNLLIGASNLVSPTSIEFGNISNVSTLLNAAQNQVNQTLYNAQVKRINVGWRPTSQDTYPLIGKIHGENLFVITGTKRDGVHMAPLIADDLVSQLLSVEYKSLFSDFHPQRQLIWTLDREEAIDKAVAHRISADFQHGYEKPTLKMDQLLKESYRRDIENIHDLCGAGQKGLPVEMLEMYRYGHAKI